MKALIIQMFKLFFIFNLIIMIISEKMSKRRDESKLATLAIASLIDEMSSRYKIEFIIVTFENDLYADELASRILNLTTSSVRVMKSSETYDEFIVFYGKSCVFISKRNYFSVPFEFRQWVSSPSFRFERFTTSFYKSITINYAYDEYFIKNEDRNDLCTKNKNKEYESVKHRLYHLTVTKSKVHLYNCDIFSGDSCDPNWTQVNSFILKNQTWSEKFFKKKVKYNRCRISIHLMDTTFNELLDFTVNEEGTIKLSGVEGGIVQLFADEMMINFTLYDRKSAELSFELIIGVTRTFYNGYHKGIYVYHATAPILITQGTFIVTKGLRFTPTEKLILPFDGATWIALASTLIISIVATYLMTLMSTEIQVFIFGFRTKNQILTIIQSFFGVGVITVPGGNISRFIFMIYTLAFLVVRNAYQGKMFEFVTSNVTQSTAKTVQDLFDMKIPMIIHDKTILQTHSIR